MCGGKKSTCSLMLIGAVLLAMTLAACGKKETKTYTVGILNNYTAAEPVIEGFKAKLDELGYVEGENITYIYKGVLDHDSQAFDAELESLVTQEVDLILTVSQQVALKAQPAVEGTDVPVLFDTAFDPVGLGLVESLSHPGGNLTGVQFVSAYPKAVEWLLKVAPETTQLYVPYGASTAQFVEEISETAAALGVTVVAEGVQSAEEVLTAIETLPEGAAIFYLPSTDLLLGDFIGVAIEHDLAVGSSVKDFIEMGALVVYGLDPFAMGEQGARMADQLFRGTASSDLPVEALEHYSSINLQTAEAIGLDIPEDVLRQADTIVR